MFWLETNTLLKYPCIINCIFYWSWANFWQIFGTFWTFLQKCQFNTTMISAHSWQFFNSRPLHNKYAVAIHETGGMKNRINQNLSKFIEIYQNLLECTEIYQNLPKSIRIYWNLLESTKMYWNLQKLTKIDQNLPRSMRI